MDVEDDCVDVEDWRILHSVRKVVSRSKFIEQMLTP